MPVRGRRHTPEEKQRRAESCRRWWATNPQAKKLKEKRRKARIRYNKTKVKERLSPAARKAAGLRLTMLNKSRLHSAKERAQAAERMRARNRAGLNRREMPESEKRALRRRMLGNVFWKSKLPMSMAARKAASRRMRAANPMKRADVVARVQRTIRRRHGPDYWSRLFKRLWREGRAHARTRISPRERQAASRRMKLRNPMKNAAAVDKRRKGLTLAQRAAMSACMKQTWADGKITPAMFMGKGNVKGANKTEKKLFPMLRYFRGRFVGDGTFWIKSTQSGICRNPDFIFGSGKRKVALLVHGTYWHRDTIVAQLEIDDYQNAGWSLFVLWTRRISKWMMPTIKSEIKSWLAEIESSPSKMPVIRQFMTWNADRTTTS